MLTKKNTAKSGAARDAARGIQVKSVSEIPIGDENRIRTGIGELDRVLGGGIVLGSLILFGGDPGIGKSTLLRQVCRNRGEQDKTVLYVSGEESLAQISSCRSVSHITKAKEPYSLGRRLRPQRRQPSRRICRSISLRLPAGSRESAAHSSRRLRR